MRVKPVPGLRGGVHAALLILSCSPAWANFIVYRDYMEYQSIQIGGVAHTCSTVADPGCAFIAITGESDTSTVTPFNVTGASGLTNSLSSAQIAVSFADNTSYSADIDLSLGGLYVSVDQTNAGAGFSSTYGPTYPLATYGNAAFKTYDLASNFFASGVGPFCADLSLCQQGAALRALDGTEFVITAGRAPAYSSFSVSVAENPTIPEPGSAGLIALSLAALGAVRSARARIG
jgi:hypothetical protein